MFFVQFTSSFFFHPDADAASKRRPEKPPAQVSQLYFPTFDRITLNRTYYVEASSMYKTSIERRLLAAEESERESERELSQAKANIARLESDRRWLAEREQQEREERQSLEEAWNKERVGHTYHHLLDGVHPNDIQEELANANRKLRNTNLELEGRMGDLEDAYNTLKRTTESSIASQSSALVAAERRVALLQDELAHANTLAFERATTINALREQIDLLEESRANTSTSTDSTQWAVVRDELKSQAEQLRTTVANNARLAAEANKLRVRNQNVEILREEKRDLERKLARLEEYQERASRLQGELEAAKKEREAW
jgi:mitotic spindle assembly checkpoint protein MAD1